MALFVELLPKIDPAVTIGIATQYNHVTVAVVPPCVGFAIEIGVQRVLLDRPILERSNHVYTTVEVVVVFDPSGLSGLVEEPHDVHSSVKIRVSLTAVWPPRSHDRLDVRASVSINVRLLDVARRCIIHTRLARHRFSMQLARTVGSSS